MEGIRTQPKCSNDFICGDQCFINLRYCTLEELNGADTDSDDETSSEKSQVEVDEGKSILQMELVGEIAKTVKLNTLQRKRLQWKKRWTLTLIILIC